MATREQREAAIEEAVRITQWLRDGCPCRESCCVARREHRKAWEELIDMHRLILRVRTGVRCVSGKEM